MPKPYLRSLVSKSGVKFFFSKNICFSFTILLEQLTANFTLIRPLERLLSTIFNVRFSIHISKKPAEIFFFTASHDFPKVCFLRDLYLFYKVLKPECCNCYQIFS